MTCSRIGTQLVQNINKYLCQKTNLLFHTKPTLAPLNIHTTTSRNTKKSTSTHKNHFFTLNLPYVLMNIYTPQRPGIQTNQYVLMSKNTFPIFKQTFLNKTLIAFQYSVWPNLICTMLSNPIHKNSFLKFTKMLCKYRYKIIRLILMFQ